MMLGLSHVGDQYSLPLDWGREPWHGVSPRYLTKVYLQHGSFRSTFAKPARVGEIFTDPAQVCLRLKGASDGS